MKGPLASLDQGILVDLRPAGRRRGGALDSPDRAVVAHSPYGWERPQGAGWEFRF